MNDKGNFKVRKNYLILFFFFSYFLDAMTALSAPPNHDLILFRCFWRGAVFIICVTANVFLNTDVSHR